MCESGIAEPAIGGLLEDSFYGMRSRYQQRLSQSYFVGVLNKEHSCCYDSEARGPSSSNRVQFLGEVCDRPLPRPECLEEDPFGNPLIFVYIEVEGFGDIW